MATFEDAAPGGTAAALACMCNCGVSKSMTQTCSFRRVLALECCAMHYGWGAVGHDSLVARLAAVSRGEKILAGTPYAELWVGAHHKAPAVVSEPFRRVEFSAWIERRYWRSSTLYRKHALPFLFKVLSVAAPLSIQAHPDKDLAKRLHARDPANYRDANHKPELCCAITPFEALCGFKPRDELLVSVRSCPELAALVGGDRLDAIAAAPEHSAAAAAALRAAYAALMARGDDAAPNAARRLAARLALGAGSPDDALAARLARHYPDDVGVRAGTGWFDVASTWVFSKRPPKTNTSTL